MVENELFVVSMENTAFAQSYVLSKTVEINFQFQKEEKIENELGEVSMECAVLVQFCVPPKTTDQKVSRLPFKN